jgi:ketosteroid isomerase-like protein
MFDLPPPIARGIEAYDRTWDFFFADKKGPIRFDLLELKVTASDTVAFTSCFVHCEGTSGGIVDLRLTMGLRKREGLWEIAHEHHSVPSKEERFDDPML